MHDPANIPEEVTCHVFEMKPRILSVSYLMRSVDALTGSDSIPVPRHRYLTSAAHTHPSLPSSGQLCDIAILSACEKVVWEHRKHMECCLGSQRVRLFKDTRPCATEGRVRRLDEITAFLAVLHVPLRLMLEMQYLMPLTWLRNLTLKSSLTSTTYPY